MPKAAIEINPQAQAVQEKMDSISEKILGKLDELITSDKLAELDTESLAGLLKQFRQTVMAIKKPASSLQMVQIPSQPQRQTIEGSNVRERELNLQDPARRKLMRNSAKKFIEENK